MQDDVELLRQYAEDRSEAAFTELVRRNLPFVYATAMRQTGSSHRAEDVVQAVFTDLARKAGPISRRSNLVGWLYISTHFAAAKLRRSEQRREMREKAVHAMQEGSASRTPEIEWEEVRPVLDDVLQALNDRDREAILLRFFKQLSLADVGGRLGLSEDAARMRIDRSLDRLRALLVRRGIASTSAAALAAALASQPALAAPAHLVPTVSASALAGAAATSGSPVVGLKILHLMNATKTTLACLAVLAVSFSLYESRQAHQATRRLAEAGDEIATLRTRAQTAERSVLDQKKASDGLEARLAAALADRHATATIAETEVTARHLEQLKFLANINNQKLANVTLTPVMMGTAKLYPGFGQLFDLSEAEIAPLDAALQEARDQLDQLFATNAKVSLTNNSVVVTIDPFSGGEAIHAQLLKAFETALGPERFAAFQSIVNGTTPDPITRAFLSFGADTRTITIGRGATGAAPFRVTDMRRTALGSSSASIAQFSDSATLPDAYLWLAPLLPDLSGLPPPTPTTPSAVSGR